MTSGYDCIRITSRVDCEKAAIQLGLESIKASKEASYDWPPYCYLSEGDALYFNINGHSSAQCDVESVCICKKGAVYAYERKGNL